MAEQIKKNKYGLAAAAVVIMLAAVWLLAGCKKKPVESPDIPPDVQHQSHENASVETTAQRTAESTEEKKADTEPATGPDLSINADTEPPAAAPKSSLEDVIRSARGWGPIHQSWYGQTAPDFTLTDITGKQHKLSDYRGKDVMLVFWATWCRPCIMEIPHLIALQNIVGKERLAILAISYISPMNTTETVKNFVGQNERINYTVFSAEQSSMSAPYNAIEGIPYSFFVNPEGKIKLATSGLLSLGYMKAILQAE